MSMEGLDFMRNAACLLTICLIVPCLARAQAQPVTFSITGDIPYSSSEIPTLRRQILDHNRYSPSEFLVHVGDFKNGTSACTESVYQEIATLLQGFAVPTFVLPGDNEWNDCASPSQAWTYWKRYFDSYESHFCHTLPVEHQDARHENFAFVDKGVLFIGINIVGGAVQSSSEWTTRLGQDAAWVEQQFSARKGEVRAAVVMGHAGPGSSQHQPFFTRFRTASAAFGKPVMYIHGDGHSWKDDRPWSEPNLRRVQVNLGVEEDPLQVTVSMDPTNPFQLRRKPWAGSPAIFNMPPCVIAGDDGTVTLPAPLALQGSSADDGDPAPAHLSPLWSQVSGPGMAQFADPQALGTNVSFNLPGLYVLRLTVSDGALQTSDDLQVDVKGVVASSVLSIANAAIQEGDSGTKTLAFDVTLAGATGKSVSVKYRTLAGTATSGGDFASSKGTLKFSGTTTSQQVLVTINGDTQIEPDETFVVELYSASGGTIGKSRGDGMILNDDGGGASPVVTFRAVHDASVESTNMATNYGSETSLRVRSSGSPEYRSYFKFTLAGLTGNVTNAKLRLYVVDEDVNAGSVYPVANTLRASTMDWTQSVLSWNNAPDIAAPALAALGAVKVKTWVELDVTAAVGGNGTYSFAIKSVDAHSVYFSSSEGSQPPELVVTTAPVMMMAARIEPDAPDSAEAAPAHASFEITRRPANPSPGAMLLEFAAPHAGTVQLDVYDVRGSRVRRLTMYTAGSGGHITWDGRDAEGRVVSSGIYIYDVTFETHRQRGKIVLRR